MDACTALLINRRQDNLENQWSTLRNPIKKAKTIEIPLQTCIFSIILGMIDISLVVILNISTISVKHKALILTIVLTTINICRVPVYLKLTFKRNDQNMSRSLSVKKRQEETRKSASLRKSDRSDSFRRSDRSDSLRRSASLRKSASSTDTTRMSFKTGSERGSLRITSMMVEAEQQTVLPPTTGKKNPVEFIF